MVFTNGDNVYHTDAFASLAAQPDADVVAWDFYSRYHRPTGVPCDRFAVRYAQSNEVCPCALVLHLIAI